MLKFKSPRARFPSDALVVDEDLEVGEDRER